MELFNVKIHSLEKKRLEQIIARTITEGARSAELPVCLATLNPEILLRAKKNPSYAKLLNSFDLKIVDGFGIVLCSFFLRFKSVRRYTGIDLTEFALKKALEATQEVSIIINGKGLTGSEKIQGFLKRNFGKKQANLCNIYVTNPSNAKSLKIDKKTKVLFVALGAPSQEEVIQNIKAELPNLRFAIGVGGSFDALTGSTARVPKFLKIIGMEWFWRLVHIRSYSYRKRRIKRIFSAVFIFPIEFLKYCFNNKHHNVPRNITKGDR